MQYNTQQKRMPLPEYGRSIQNMVDYALTIQDRAHCFFCQWEHHFSQRMDIVDKMCVRMRDLFAAFVGSVSKEINRLFVQELQVRVLIYDVGGNCTFHL